LQVSTELTARRKEFARAVVDAKSIVVDFAARHGWEKQAQVSMFDTVEIFSSQQDLWQRVKELNKLPAETPLPTAGLVAGLESRVLLAVHPEEYARISPAYATAQKDAWTRLLAHEIAHRLHVVILNGNEDAMGPAWFFEGFAVLAAGQAIGSDIVLKSSDDALAQVADAKSKGAYSRYAAAVRFFLTKTSLSELVAKAGQKDFEAWLKSLHG